MPPRDRSLGTLREFGVVDMAQRFYSGSRPWARALAMESASGIIRVHPGDCDGYVPGTEPARHRETAHATTPGADNAKAGNDDAVAGVVPRPRLTDAGDPGHGLHPNPCPPVGWHAGTVQS